MSILENGVLAKGFLNLDIINQLTPQMVIFMHFQNFLNCFKSFLDFNISRHIKIEIFYLCTNFFQNFDIFKTKILQNNRQTIKTSFW